MENIPNKVPYGYCHCGCGRKTKISTQNRKAYGWVKGEPFKYIKYHISRSFRKANKDKKTYPVNGHGQRKHVVAAEKAFGKKLPIKARIHHVDLDFRNYKPGNLVICPDDAYHNLLHVRTEAFQKCGNANYKRCIYCKAWDDPKNMTKYSGRATHYHKECNNEYHIKRRQGLYKRTGHSYLYKTNTSGVVGVHWNKRASKWIAVISVGGRKVSLGSFSFKNDAIAARKKAEGKYNIQKNRRHA